MQELYQKYKLLFLFLLVGIGGFLIWYFSEIVIIVIAAAVISIIGSPLVNLFDKITFGKFKFPHTLSVSITLFAILLLFLGFFALFIPLVINEAQLIANIDGKHLVEYYNQELESLRQFLVQYNVLPRGMTIEKSIKQMLLKFIDFGLFSNVLSSVVSFTGNFFFILFSVFFLSFFFLMDVMMLPGAILKVTPKKSREHIRTIMLKSKTLLSRYFIGLIVQICANILTYSIVLYIVGVPSALMIGFFAGIIIIIPYLGGIISMIMGVIIGVTGVISMGDFSLIVPMILKIVVAMLVVQTIDNNIFAPIIQGKSMKAHPVEIFLVVIAAGSFGGIIGMVLAVPAYGFIKIVANEFTTKINLVNEQKIETTGQTGPNQP